MIGIYAIVNARTGDTYVGASVNIEQRITGHLGQIRHGTCSNRKLRESVRAHGADVFFAVALEYCPQELLDLGWGWEMGYWLHVQEAQWAWDLKASLNYRSGLASGNRRIYGPWVSLDVYRIRKAQHLTAIGEASRERQQKATFRRSAFDCLWSEPRCTGANQ